MAFTTLRGLLVGFVAVSALKHVERGARSVPTEKDILASPTAVLAKMNNETENLASEISAAENKSQERVAALRAELKADLAKKRLEALAVEEENHKLRVNTTKLSAKVGKLHGEAKELRANHSAMLAELAKLSGDFDTSLTFIAAMLKTSQGLDNDTEVSVLEELDSKDAGERAAAAKRAWQQSLQRVSLLQESPASFVVPDDAATVLSSMAATLEDITKKRIDDEHALRSEFAAMVARVARQKERLLAEQSQLTETMRATADLVGRLAKATEFLKYSNDRLHGKIVALRRYVAHLGPPAAKP